MRKAMIILLIMPVFIAGCKKTPTYQSYGHEVITSDADERIIEAAILMVHNAMADWEENPDGSKSDSSYSASGQSYSGSDQPTVKNSKIEFKTKDGATCTIEHSFMRNAHFIKLSSDRQDQTKKLYDELVKHLQNAGVKPAKN